MCCIFSFLPQISGDRNKFIQVISAGQETLQLDGFAAPPEAEHWMPGPLSRHKAFPNWVLLMNRDLLGAIGWIDAGEAATFESWDHRRQVEQLQEFQANSRTRNEEGKIMTAKDELAQARKRMAEAAQAGQRVLEEMATKEAAKKAARLEEAKANEEKHNVRCKRKIPMKVSRKLADSDNSNGSNNHPAKRRRDSDSNSDNDSSNDAKIAGKQCHLSVVRLSSRSVLRTISGSQFTKSPRHLDDDVGR